MPRWRIPRWVRDPWGGHVDIAVYDDDLDRERRLTYKHIDDDNFGWLTVFVAGAGFLTDIYDVVASKVVLPMLAIVYWNGKIPQHEKAAIDQSLLAGMLIGQITLGVLADRYGRKGIYGITLIIIMVATVGLALPSRGAEDSVDILPWLIVWRLLMGFGIGGDFPLSAAITAEFAPRKHRAKMLAAVFFMKPVGEILANVVAIVAIEKSCHRISPDADLSHCVGECRRATDQIWRWVVGLGAILPAGALILRLQIPESLRYTLEVEKDIRTARNYRVAHFPPQSLVSANAVEEAAQPTEQSTNESTPGSWTSDTGELHLYLSEHGDQTSRRPPMGELMTPIPSGSSTQATSARIGNAQEHEEQRENGSVDSNGNSVEQASQNERREVRKETWGEFWREFRVFLFTEKKWKERRIGDGHWTEGSWTDLAGTSLTWMLLDLSYYFLGVYDPTIISELWNSPEYTAVYPMLMQSGWRALISNSIGALVGGAIFIAMARYRYNLQLYGFLILAVLFVTVGVTFLTLSGGRYFAVIITFYGWCRLFYNLGPNPSVFIIPAEVFPTRFRCTCHGMSAAAGKFGSILAQLIINSNDWKPTSLGKAILILTICHVLGAIVTKLWVPNPCDINGESRKLEDLSHGKNARKILEAKELEMRPPSAQEGHTVG